MRPDLPRTFAASERVLAIALVVLIVVRLVSLPLYPLMDTTEARYADIARRMLERGDLVTPSFGDAQPFWGKPPLSFWATWSGFALLGVNEIGARLPHYLLGAAVVAMVWRHARRHSRRKALHATALLCGAALFMTASGAVLTDMAMTVGTTMTMLAFWRSVEDGRASHARTASIALGAAIGLLAKGPVALVLAFGPIAAWVVVSGRWRDAIGSVRWVQVLGLAAIVGLPWYVLAERATPGFLEYFVVGEHWRRFTVPGWAGDLYGTTHEFPRGTIWLFALAAILPWSLLAPVLAWAARRPMPSHRDASDGEVGFLLATALAPCVLFTLAGNVIWTYVLPGLPALALAGARRTANSPTPARVDRVLTAGMALVTAFVVAWLSVGWMGGGFEARSTRSLVRRAPDPALRDAPIVFLGKVPFSASFYSAGRARAVESLDRLPTDRPLQLVVERDAWSSLPQESRRNMTVVATTERRVLVVVR